MKFHIIHIVFFILYDLAGYSQTKTISGRITDPEGNSLKGIEITIPQIGLSEYSDINGNYSIVIPDSILQLNIKHLSWKDQVVDIGDNRSIDIELVPLEAEDFYQMAMDELLNIKISVASKKALIQHETPGVVSVITTEEIIASGARDLIDVLRLVPGVDFSIDVEGVVGISMRGNWSNEGRILMIIDGLEMNELAFSTLQFGNHFSVDQIKRIEIIRGPGSSIYGGNAELGVINIITNQGEDINGIYVSGTYGQMEKTYGRRNLNLSVGKKINDFEFSLHSFIGEGNRSDQVFTDIFGSQFDLSKGGSSIKPANINAGIGYKGISARFIYDNYRNITTSLWDAGVDPPFHLNFESFSSELKYDLELNDKLNIVSKINYSLQKPWNSTDDRFLYSIEVSRIKANLYSSYDANKTINIILGGEYYTDNAVFDDDEFFNNSNNFSYSNLSIFAQALFQTKFANLTLGSRVDIHSEVNSAFSPRISLTKAFEKLYFKVLYNHAFRTPGVENMNLAYTFDSAIPEPISPKIKPEKTVATEFELGYIFNKKTVIAANVYSIEVSDPIVYFFFDNMNGNTEEGYYNDSRTGSQGAELQYKIKDNWGYVNFSYSFYATRGINEVELFEVPDNENIFLAFPQHKLALNSNFRATRNLNISPSFVFRTQRYTYRQLDADDFEILSEEDPIFLLNLYISYQNLFIKGLTIGCGIYDILGQNDYFFQPYNLWHAPWPGPSREFLFKITYTFKFK